MPERPLSALFADATRRGDDNRPNLTAEQQITRLTEYFSQVYVPEREQFYEGEIIWHRCPAASNIKGAEAPFIFIEYIDTPIPAVEYVSDVDDVHSHSAAAVLDCRLGTLRGETFLVFLMDSREFTERRRS